MRVNKQKIESEMKRLDITLEELGTMMTPKMSRRATWYMVSRSKSFRPIQRIAKALQLDPKDLII
jgi:hypothetical protein